MVCHLNVNVTVSLRSEALFCQFSLFIFNKPHTSRGDVSTVCNIDGASWKRGCNSGQY